MAELKKFEFFLLRYVPDAVREEFVNIGLVMTNAESAELRFTRDYRSVRCLDPAADLEMLQALELDLRRNFAGPVSDRDALLAFLHDTFSNTLQLSPVKAVLGQSIQQEADRLVSMYLETRRPGRPKEAAAGRQIILGRMKNAFEQAGVWKLMHHQIRAAEFTHPGDPLKIDCGYRPHGNGTMKMFQALSLAGDVDAAKVLAFSFPLMRDGMAHAQKLDAALTAVVEDDLPRDDDAIAFALDALARTQIAVAPASHLPELAETARREMRV